MPNISIDQLQIFDSLDGSQIFPHVHPTNNVTYHAHVSAIFYDNAVTENVIQDGAVTTDKIADQAITSEKLAPGAVTFSDLTVDKLVVSDSIASDHIRINQLDYTFPAIREANKFLKHTNSGNLEWATAAEIAGGGSGSINLVSGQVLPVGAITQWGSTDTPAGWLFCHGQGFDGTQYPELSTIVGDTYKVHDGNTYYLPDLRARVPVGVGSTRDDNNLLSSFTIGMTGGEFKHRLTIREMPSHTHNVGTVLPENPTAASSAGFSVVNLYPKIDGLLDNPPTVQMKPASFAGLNGSHQNVQPFLATEYIIKAKPDTVVNFQPSLGSGLSAKDADGTVNTSSLNLSSSEIGLLVDGDDFKFDGDKRLQIKKALRPKFVPLFNYNNNEVDTGPTNLGIKDAFRGVSYGGSLATKFTSAPSTPEGRTGGIESTYNLSLFNSGINEGQLGYIKPGSIGGVYFNVFDLRSDRFQDIRFSYIYPDSTAITDVFLFKDERNIFGAANIGSAIGSTMMLPVNEGQTQMRTFVGSFDVNTGGAINVDLNVYYHIIGVQVYE